MKKIISVFLSVAIAIFLCACDYEKSVATLPELEGKWVADSPVEGYPDEIIFYENGNLKIDKHEATCTADIQLKTIEIDINGWKCNFEYFFEYGNTEKLVLNIKSYDNQCSYSKADNDYSDLDNKYNISSDSDNENDTPLT